MICSENIRALRFLEYVRTLTIEGILRNILDVRSKGNSIKQQSACLLILNTVESTLSTVWYASIECSVRAVTKRLEKRPRHARNALFSTVTVLCSCNRRPERDDEGTNIVLWEITAETVRVDRVELRTSVEDETSLMESSKTSFGGSRGLKSTSSWEHRPLWRSQPHESELANFAFCLKLVV